MSANEPYQPQRCPCMAQANAGTIEYDFEYSNNGK